MVNPVIMEIVAGLRRCELVGDDQWAVSLDRAILFVGLLPNAHALSSVTLAWAGSLSLRPRPPDWHFLPGIQKLATLERSLCGPTK